jgi:hypothetical protein
MNSDRDFENDFSPLGELGNPDFSYEDMLEKKIMPKQPIEELK